MSVEAVITLVLLLATLLLMGTQRLRNDVTAILVMLTLILSNILTVEEAFSAFGQPVIIILGSLFVIGAALYETGVATVIASQILRLSKRGYRFVLLMIMLAAALLSAFISNLLVVAVFLPAVLRVAQRARISPAQLLLPLNTAGVMGSLLTLIGAVSNIVVNDLLVSRGYESLGLFGLAPYGLVFLTITILWFQAVGKGLLSTALPAAVARPSLGEVERAYELENQLYQVRVRAASDLIGQRLNETGLGAVHRLNVVAIQPANDDLRGARGDWILERDDILVVQGTHGDVLQAAALHHLEPKQRIPLDRFERMRQQPVRLAEVIVPFRSALVGKTVAESHFREQYGLNILAVHREQGVLHGELADVTLHTGDTLLVQGPMRRLHEVGKDLNLVLVTHLGPRRGELVSSKMGLTLAILAAVIAAVVVGWLPLATSALAGALALILTGCISIDRAYKSIDASILLVVGGLLPLADALQKTGLATVFAETVAGLQAGPLVALALLYLAAALITQVVSNTVVAVLLFPVALSLANALGVPPHPFAIALIAGATASYVTPLTNGSNLMILEPGRYKMHDYLINNGPIFLLQSVALFIMLSIFYF